MTLPIEILDVIMEYVPADNYQQIASNKDNLHLMDRYFIKFIHYAWAYICDEEWMLPVITKHADKLYCFCWDTLCYKPWALPLLKSNIDKIDYVRLNILCSQSHSRQFVEDISYIVIPRYWDILSKFEWAHPMLKANVDKIVDPFAKSLLTSCNNVFEKN